MALLYFEYSNETKNKKKRKKRMAAQQKFTKARKSFDITIICH